jgi:uncharacterized protein YutE (UPF0331/DUF86 family)
LIKGLRKRIKIALQTALETALDNASEIVSDPAALTASGLQTIKALVTTKERDRVTD